MRQCVTMDDPTLLFCRQCHREPVPSAGMLCPSCAVLLATAVFPAEVATTRIFEASSGARYVVDDGPPLGEGAFGRVLRAKQADSGITVALKVLKAAPHDDPDAQMEWRFTREMDALLTLDHPGIVKLHARGVDAAGRPWLAMDYVDGTTLSAWLRQKSPSRRDRLEVFAHACDAIQYAHERGVLHRDLKPGNILIEERTGTPRIIDFGLAKFFGESLHASLTRNDQALGTPMYMAPELLEGGRQGASTRSDVYALGVMLYVMLADSTPYDASLTTLELMAAVRTRSSASILKAAPGLPADLAAVVRRAMAREADERYSGAGALAADVRRYLGGFPVEACRSSLLYTTGKFARRHWKKLSVVAAAAATLVTAGVYHLRQMQERTATASAAYREARNQMAWTITKGVQQLRAVGRTDAIGDFLGPAEHFPWDLPIDDGGAASPAWESALLKARIQFLNGEIRLGQSDFASAEKHFAAAESLANEAARDASAAPDTPGYAFEYRGYRLRAQARQGCANVAEVTVWLEQCRDFPADHWKDITVSRPQAAAELLADTLPLMAAADPAAAARWLEEVARWVEERLALESKDVIALKLKARLLTAAARLPSGDAAAAWETATQAWGDARKRWPLNAEMGEEEVASLTELVNHWRTAGDLDRAFPPWQRAWSTLRGLRDNFIFGIAQAPDEALFRATVSLATGMVAARRWKEAGELCAAMPVLYKSVDHNLSPERVVDGKCPDLWPVLAEGRLAEARTFVATGQEPAAYTPYHSASDLLGDLRKLVPANYNRWVLERCQVMIEWAAVKPGKPVQYSPAQLLKAAADRLMEITPANDAEKAEATRLDAAIKAALATLNGIQK